MMSAICRIESMLSALAEKIESFSSDRMRVIVGCSLAAGLSIPVAWFGFLRISVLWRINTASWAFMLTFALACVSCYMAAGLLVILVKAHRKIALSWFLVVVLGSFILAIFAGAWRNPEIWQLSAYDLISVHLRDALERTVWLSLFTLPFAAVVKYSGGMVRAVKRWHTGRDYSLSILGR
jgi:hypothetical protein